MKTFIFVLLAGCGIALVLHVSAKSDTRRNEYADCIAREAQEQGYPEPYSAEAWRMFAGYCD